jgi:hypothetical protein
MDRKIAIIGGGPSWVRAPWNDPTWEKWLHSSCFEGVPPDKVDRWFEVHRPDVRAGEKTWSTRYRTWLTGGDCDKRTRRAPVYVLDKFPRMKRGVPKITNRQIPNKVIIPRAKIEKFLQSKGAVKQEYTTSTAVWMFKQAMFENVSNIGIWGITYNEHAEYIVQRPCMEHWIGFARALGITVYVTPSSSLCRDEHIYGFDGPHKNLVHTMQPFRAEAKPVTVRQALGMEAMHNVPPFIQQLIDREKELFGIDTEQLWKDAAKER